MDITIEVNEIIAESTISETVITCDVVMSMESDVDKAYVDNQLDLKVDKVDGKGLSTNDYTNEEKNSLANKVDKIENYSLVPATEIDKLSEYPEFDDLPLGVTAHEDLTDKNSEAAVQHVDTTTVKNTLVEADKVAILDSVTNKLVLTPKSSFFGGGAVIFDSTFSAVFLDGVWSADAATDVLSSTVDHGLLVGDTVSFSPGTGLLPAGIIAEPDYYFVESVPNSKAIKIKSAWNGAAFNFTDNGVLGWKIRNGSVPVSIPLDFNTYTEIEIYSNNFSMLQNSQGNSYLGLNFSPANLVKIFLNDVNVYGATAAALLYSSIATKKYVKIPFKITIRKFEDSNYFIEICANGLQSDNLSFTSAAVYTRIFSGILTGANLTRVEVGNPYTWRAKSGTRVIIVKK